MIIELFQFPNFHSFYTSSGLLSSVARGKGPPHDHHRTQPIGILPARLSEQNRRRCISLQPHPIPEPLDPPCRHIDRLPPQVSLRRHSPSPPETRTLVGEPRAAQKKVRSLAPAPHFPSPLPAGSPSSARGRAILSPPLRGACDRCLRVLLQIVRLPLLLPLWFYCGVPGFFRTSRLREDG